MNTIKEPNHPSLKSLIEAVSDLVAIEKELSILNFDDVLRAEKRIRSILKDTTKKSPELFSTTI